MSRKLDRLIEAYHSVECEFNLDKSIDICKEILRLDSTLIEYQSHLASSYYSKREYEKSIELYKDYIEKGGDKDDSFLMIALSYIKLNNIDKAFEYLEEIQDEKSYLFSKFRAYMEMEDYGKAIEYGDRLLEMDPENHLCLHLMSELYERIEDHERSIFYFNELANLYPELKSIELIRLYSLGKYDEMIEIFEEYRKTDAFRNDWENEGFNFIIGMAYYELQRPYDSLKYLLESDRLKEDLEKKIAIAKNYLNLSQFDNAFRHLREALKINPLDETCLFLMMETCYYMEDHLKSIEYANRLLGNYQYDKAFHVLGAVYFDLGENEKAFESIKVGTNGMIEEDEYDEEYILKIAKRLSKAGLSERALNIYNKLIKEYPDFDYIYFERASLYRIMGNEELAKKDFRKYNDLMLKEKREIEEILNRYPI